MSRENPAGKLVWTSEREIFRLREIHGRRAFHIFAHSLFGREPPGYANTEHADLLSQIKVRGPVFPLFLLPGDFCP